MNKGHHLLILLLLFNLTLLAQKRADIQLVVYGQGDAAFGAAVQSANSGIQTLWVNPDQSFESSLTQGDEILKVTSYQNLDGGLWGEFLKSTVNASQYTDSVFNRAKRHLNPRIALNSFEKIIDSVSNLTVVYGTTINEIRRTRKDWRLGLNNGSDYKVFAVVDATENAALLQLVDLEEKISDSSIMQRIPIKDIYASTAFKTSLMIDERQNVESIVPASVLIRPYAKNLFTVFDPDKVEARKNSSIQDVPRRILLGQVLGAMAGYCAFFELDYDKINIRTLQGELLAFKAQLIPFHDIAFEDVHNTFIQHISLSGILKGRTGEKGKFIFDPAGTVSTDEIEFVMRNIYTRSQIWFNQHSIEKLSVGETIDLIKFIALKGDEVDRAVQNGWHSRFHFESKFDANNPITRRQFAVLVDTYLQPFSVKVDKKGNFVY